jgi:5'(3')-deoxyribonucleotidase
MDKRLRDRMNSEGFGPTPKGSPKLTLEEMVKKINERIEGKMKKKILYIDMDNVLVDFKSALDIQTEDILKEYVGREDEIPNLFGKMQPVKDAVESFKKLSKKYDTYILSTAPWENPSAWSDKLEWVKRHLGELAYKRLILTHHKHLNHGDYLIDDRTKNGADKFSGELILFGSDGFPNWQSVCAYLLNDRN